VDNHGDMRVRHGRGYARRQHHYVNIDPHNWVEVFDDGHHVVAASTCFNHSSPSIRSKAFFTSDFTWPFGLIRNIACPTNASVDCSRSSGVISRPTAYAWLAYCQAASFCLCRSMLRDAMRQASKQIHKSFNSSAFLAALS